MTDSHKKSSGSVALVGAGPGDAGLITVRGCELLKAADVVVHDALILPSLLALANGAATLIDVGKRHADHKMTQDQINDLLLREARAGHRVVRLKGGDPFVFGRGAEEAAFLGKQGVACEIVPGVTAAVAAAAMAGIPVTHRHFASSVTFITGHEDTAKSRSATDYKALASLIETGGTLCIYMGMFRIEAITDELLAQGLPADTPAAIVEWGATPRQRSMRTTLDRLSSLAADELLAAPAIIIIGRVAAIEEPGLDAYTARPLFGRRIIITRAGDQAGPLRELLEERGAEVLEAPTIAIEPAPAEDMDKVDSVLRAMHPYDWLVLTSGNGVEALARRMEALNLDGRIFANIRIATVGSATAAALERMLRLRADLTPETFVAESLAADLIQTTPVPQRFLLLRADIARPTLPQLLRDTGAIVDDLPIYRTRPVDDLPPRIMLDLERGRIDWITFTSSSTVRNMLELLGENRTLLAGVKIASIGPITSQTLREHQLEPTIEAAPSTIEGLVHAMSGQTR